MGEFRLTKQERLSGKKRITELMERGKRGFVYPFRYVWLPTDEPTAILFSVPKRQHKRAVRRNLLRRRTREAYRLNKAIIGATTAHIALIYSSSQIHNFNTIQNAICKILAEVGKNN